jgi:hypothetical protein
LTVAQNGYPGATAEEWEHFATTLGLCGDLLPVVSEISSEISPRSGLQALGKTPSIYNSLGLVVGIPDWSRRVTTPRQLANYASDPRLGICIQTRQVRAIDIDVGDPILSEELVDMITSILGHLPTRGRDNSSKKLLAFTMEGEFRKRIISTRGGMLEFLANGQQFIAAGTHPSGARYAWQGGLPAEFPVISPDSFEQVWTAIELLYAVAPGVRSPMTQPARTRLQVDAKDDAVTDYVKHHVVFKSQDSAGRVHVTCPWESEHSTASNLLSTDSTYFPAGIGGYAKPAYRCQHAHCAHRGIYEFLQAIGYESAQFDDVAPVKIAPIKRPALRQVTHSVKDTPLRVLTLGNGHSARNVNEWLAATDSYRLSITAPLPGMLRNKAGGFECNVTNISRLLQTQDALPVGVCTDAFKGELMIQWGAEAPRQLIDEDLYLLRMILERVGMARVATAVVREALLLAAKDKTIDTAQNWLNSLVWDGVPRVDTMLTRLFGVDDTEYTRACSRYWLTALAGRVLEPGCKADMALIFTSAEGTGKTSGIKALAPSPAEFTEIDLASQDDNLSRQLRGKLIGELSEMRGLHARMGEATKSWMTKTHDEWVPKYKEFARSTPRRFIVTGSTNRATMLSEEATGRRRWLPFKLGRFIDVDGIHCERNQLWAEGAVMFRLFGVEFDQAEQLARAEHEKFIAEDTWQSAINDWLHAPAGEFDGAQGGKNGDGLINLRKVLVHAVGLPVSRINPSHEARAAAVLSRLGFEPQARGAGTTGDYVWKQS